MRAGLQWAQKNSPRGERAGEKILDCTVTELDVTFVFSFSVFQNPILMSI